MSSQQPQPAAPLVEHFFRHEAGRLVSVLTRFFGWRNFDLVEDMVQATLVDALQAWRLQVPDNPSGWVHRVAKNKVLDEVEIAPAEEPGQHGHQAPRFVAEEMLHERSGWLRLL